MNRQLFDALAPHLDLGRAKPDPKGWIKIRSPLRPDKSPSFAILPDDDDDPGAFKDYSTQEGGSLLELCRLMNIEPPPLKVEPVEWGAWARARKMDPIKVARIFGITGTTTIHFPTPCGVDRLRGLTNGKSAPKWARKGGRACPYGLAESRSFDGPIYLVEGEPSVWQCVSRGVAAVCTMMGVNGADAIASELLADGREVVVAYDADDAGRKGTRAALESLTAAGVKCRAVRLTGPKGYDVDDLARTADDLAAALAALPDFDEPEGPTLPEGYELGDAGLTREGELVAECRVDVINVGVDVDDGRHVWRIKWHAGELDIPRADLAASRSLVPWSGYGLPVDQHNAGELVRYLTAYERHNRDRITRQTTSTSSGWYGDSYLRGRHRHGPAPYYRAGDPGRDQWVEGIVEQGDPRRWYGVMLRALARPIVRLLACGALASTVTQRARLTPAIIDVGGTTSQGKTSALFVALSCIGDPARMLRTWDTTRIAVERSAAYSRGLTMAYDDTMRARRIEDVAGACYDVVSGVSRSRGSASGGLQAAPSSHSWILSTGEGPLVDMVPGIGGLRSRVLTISRSTWGGTSPTLGEEIRHIVTSVHDHHGHALPAVVEHLLTCEVADLRARHATLASGFAARIYARHPTHAVGDRIAQSLAALELTGQILGDACGFPCEQWVDLDLADHIADRAATADRSLAALETVTTAAHAASGRIFGVAKDDPPLGWIGSGTLTSEGDWHELALDPQWVRDTLRRAGHEPGTVIAMWIERGIIDRNGSRSTHKVRVGSSRPRLFRINVSKVC